jgi:hypothetical protein
MAAVEAGDGVADADGVAEADGMAVLEAVGVLVLAEAVDFAELKTPAIADPARPTPTTRTATMMATDHSLARLAR